MRTLLATMASLLLALPVAADPVGVGDAVPDLGVESFLNAPDDARIPVGEKVVVLEFWATWCGPCVSAIPHMNDLTERFADDDRVRFVSVTVNEGADVIEPFLKQRPIAGWVGLDPDGSAANTFGIRGIPSTVIIGRDGKVAARTYPTSLKAEHIEAALAGEAIEGLAPPADADVEVVPLTDDAAAPAALVEAWVRPAADPDGPARGMGGASELTYTNYRAAHLVRQFANGRVVGPRVAMEATLPEGTFDLYVRVPPERAFQVDELGWDAVAFAFGLTKFREIRDTPALELRAIPGQDDRRSAAVPEGRPSVLDDFNYDDGYTIDAKSVTPGYLRHHLGNLFASPVVIGMDDSSPFDLLVTIPPTERGEGWEDRTVAAANAELAAYGLVLERVVAPIEHTVVRDRGTFGQEDAARREGRPTTLPAAAADGPATRPATP